MNAFFAAISVAILGLVAYAVSRDRFTNKMREIIMSEAQAAVDQVVEQLGKAKDEIVGEIAKLEEQVAAGQPVDLTALKAAAQALDDVVSDPVVESETPVEPEVPAEPETPAEPSE